MSKSFEFILEAGVNHDGDLERAYELVDSAARTGADYVKFQTYTSDKLAARVSPSYWDLKEESTTSQRELFSKYDGFTTKDYFDLARACNKAGIGFMTTCFDSEWVEALDPIIPQYKIASADITNFQLLRHVASKGKPMLISTGAASFAEAHAAVGVVRSVSNVKISLMHCVLNYPTPPENASLNRISKLIEEFPGVQIGYSDHTKPVDSVQALQIALDLGATVFEKHYTWNQDGVGNDHYHSFDEVKAREVISLLSKSELLKSFTENEFLEKQDSARKFARRGIYASRNLAAGEVISSEDLIPLRPPIGAEGFSGDEIDEIVGSRLLTDLAVGDPILRSSLSQ
jgi:N-acetylneuraminate synthase